MLWYKFILITIIISITSAQRVRNCQTDDKCKAKASCSINYDDNDEVGRCVCNDGFVLDRNVTFYQCLPNVKLNDPCDEKTVCNSNDHSYCNDQGVCVCTKDTREYQQKCYLQVSVNEICMSNGNCAERGAFCNETGRCECKNGTALINDKCVSIRQLGEPCDSDDQCLAATNFTKCKTKCECDTDNDYTLSRDDKSCTKILPSHFGDSCTMDADCSAILEESVCNWNKCDCREGFYGLGKKCIRLKDVGEKCTRNEECIRILLCDAGICKKICSGSSTNNLDKILYLLIFLTSLILFV